MVEFVRCKVCGYVIKDSKLKDLCPACGVKRTAFEPYEEKVAAKRKKLLDYHIHPILVHFPNAFIPILLVLSISILFFQANIQEKLFSAVQILGVLLPFMISAAAAAGILDGKARFKKLKTPMLLKKIIFGSTALFLSIAIAILVFFIDYTTMEIFWIIGLSLLSLGAVGPLGLIGGKLVCAIRIGN